MIYTPHGAPPGFDWVREYDSYQLTDDTLILTVKTAAGAPVKIAFSALTAHIWRMRVVIPGMDAQAQTTILIPQTAPLRRLNVQETGDHLTVSAVTTDDEAVSALTLSVDFDPFCIRFHDASGRDVLRENPSDIDGLGRPFVLPLGFVADAANPLIVETFHLRADEHLFGLGEKFTPLDKRGQTIISWTQDAFGSTSERSHKNIPFLISTRGYGLLLDTGARITWELGTVSAQSYTFKMEGTTLDAYIIAGDTPAVILRRYTDLTGRTSVPPRWSFGLWLSGGGVHRDRAAMEALVEGTKTHDLPVDVIHIDTWWMRWRHYADWRFDPVAFPNIETFIEDLHAQGLKLSLWEQPYISVESDRFEYGKAHGYLLTRPDGEVYVIDYGLSLAPRPDGIVRTAESAESWNAPVAIVDLTQPEAVAWFQAMHRDILRLGVDVFKTDFGEDVPRDAVFANGQTGAALHNLYPLLYNEAVTQVMREEKGYALVWSRSGTAGSQRYPVCWSGDPAADWDSLACTIRGGLSIGMSGIPFWSSDIGGFRGMPGARLYVRWAQFTLLCSHARMHGDSAREPWAFGDEALAIVRDFVRLRYRLFPYLYSAAHEAAKSGMPVIRAMPLAFPDDPNTYDKDLQFMLGDSLLVAPIYDESDSRMVYLPAGKWIDFWTHEWINGGINLRVDAPLDRIPVFVRAGAIIPMMEDANRIPDRIDLLIVNVYPGSNGEAVWYDDTRTIPFRFSLLDRDRLLEWKNPLPSVQIRFIDMGGTTEMEGSVPFEMESSSEDLIVTLPPCRAGYVRLRE